VLNTNRIRPNQVQHAECGIASMAYIFDYFLIDSDIHQLRRRYPNFCQGMTPFHIKQVAEDYKIDCKVYDLTYDDLNSIKTPVILLTRSNHFIVLLSKLENNCFEVYDPTIGLRKIGEIEFSSLFLGVTIEFIPPESNARSPTNIIRSIFNLYSDEKVLYKTILVILFWSIVVQAFSIITPFFSKYLIDTVAPSQDYNLLFITSIVFLMTSILGHLFSFIRSKITLKLGQSLSYDAMKDVFNHLIVLPISYFENRHIGDISSRMNSMSKIQQTVISDVPGLCINFVVIISTFLVMIYMEWRIATVSFIFIVTQLYYSHRLNQKRHYLESKRVESSAELGTSTLEVIQSNTAIKAFGIEGIMSKKWEGMHKQSFSDIYNTSNQSITQGFFESIISTSHYIFITCLGIWFIMNPMSNFTVGSLIAILAYQGMLSGATRSFVRELNNLNRLRVHIERLEDIILTQAEREISESNELPTEITSPYVSFENVTFNFGHGNKNLINNFNFEFKSSKTIVIIGKSGSGKTTLAKLILGLYANYSGRIVINGDEIGNVSKSLLNQNTGVVMQNDRLFSGTVAENIALFESKFDQQRVEYVAKLANIYNDIIDKPLRFKTQVGGLTSSFSSGQTQRILIARAIYSNPRMLIMDEGTANLDEKNEIEIAKNLLKLDCLKIYITHRPALLNFANEIFHLTESGIIAINRNEADKIIAGNIS